MKHPLQEMMDKRRQGIRCGIPSYCSANELVIEIALRRAKERNIPVLIEATANQVNQFGGYTGMKPADFYQMVLKMAKDIDLPENMMILAGDHLGPLTWQKLPEAEAMKNSVELVYQYARAGFTKIHLDTSMKVADDAPGLLKTEVIARRGAQLYKAAMKGYEELKAEKPDAMRPVFVIGTVAFITAFVLYLYAIILVGSVVKVWGVDNSLTFENYHYVFTFGMKAIKDTLLIACIGTPLGGLLAVLIGYVCKWLKIRGHKTLETVSLLNYTLPGTVVGIAYIIAFNDQPLVLTGTVYILIAAYVFRYSSAGIRNVIAALTQIDPSIEEASTSLGASSAYTFRKITVPLVLPAVLTGMRYLFIHSMTAISATIFLVSVNWTLITTRILECMTELQFAQACAFSIVLILIVFAASAFMALMAKVLCPVGDASGGLR